MKSNTLTIYSNLKKRPVEDVFVSDEAANSMESDDIEIISNVVAEVNKALNIVSSLPGYEINAERVDTARKEVDAGVLRKLKSFSGGLSEKILLKLFCTSLKEKKSGNCYEFSLLCYKLLGDKGRKTEIVRMDGGGHVFLVYNRRKGTNIADVNSWNKDAIVIDPFFSKVYLSTQIQDHLLSCVHDNLHNVVSYVPYNPKKHRLSNDVISGMVDDWSKVLVAARSASKR